LDIVQTLEEDNVEKVVVFGHTRKKLVSGDTDTDLDLFFAKQDYSDSTYWQKLNGFSNDEESLAIFENPIDSSLMLIGSAQNDTEGKNVYVVQATNFGTADLGSVNTGISGSFENTDDHPRAATRTSLGYSVVGSTTDVNGREAGFHVAFNNSGRLIPSSSHVLTTSFELAFGAHGLTSTIDNQLMVVGSVPSFVGVNSATENRDEEAVLMKVNPLSGRIANREDQSFGTDVGSDRAVAAITLPDGDIMVLATFDFGSETTLAGLMRLNREGELLD